MMMLNKMKTRKNVHMHHFNKIKIHKTKFSRELTKDATNTIFEDILKKIIMMLN